MIKYLCVLIASLFVGCLLFMERNHELLNRLQEVNTRSRQQAIDNWSTTLSSAPWLVRIPTHDDHGHRVDLIIYPHPLQGGGFVINCQTENDKDRGDGKCHGTVIFKGEALE